MPSAFVPLVLLAELAGLATVGMTIGWMVKYYDGFALDGSGREFNLHPVFMVLGFLFFNANALMTYRILGNALKHTAVKIVHFVFQCMSVICASFGLACVFHFHNEKGFANLYSLHSWAGIATFVCFCAQLIFGFVAFLVLGIFAKNSTATLRKVCLHLHVYGGALIFVMAGVTALMGIARIITFHITNYSDLPTQAVLANSLGAVIVVFVALVGYILYNEKYKASPVHSSDAYQEQINIDQE